MTSERATKSTPDDAGQVPRGYLLDENLPVRSVTSTLPVIHARDLGPSPTDSQLWAEAQQRGWVIVSKDADFAARILAATPPPWVVHLRIGNLRLAEFAAFMARVWPQIEALLSEHKLINVYATHLEAIADG